MIKIKADTEPPDKETDKSKIAYWILLELSFYVFVIF